MAQRLAGSRVITPRGGQRFESLEQLQLHAYTTKRNFKVKVLDFVKSGGLILTVSRTLFEMRFALSAPRRSLTPRL